MSLTKEQSEALDIRLLKVGRSMGLRVGLWRGIMIDCEYILVCDCCRIAKGSVTGRVTPFATYVTCYHTIPTQSNWTTGYESNTRGNRWVFWRIMILPPPPLTQTLSNSIHLWNSAIWTDLCIALITQKQCKINPCNIEHVLTKFGLASTHDGLQIQFWKLYII